MKTIFTLLIFSATLSSYAQDWVHQGSKWHYNWVTYGSDGYREYKYTNDTIIDGRSCHRLSCTDHSSQPFGPIFLVDSFSQPSLYTYAHSDTTFFYYPHLSRWQPVYFFQATARDTIIIPNADYTFSQDTFVRALVDTVGTVTINTTPLRYYTFHIIDSCRLNIPFSGRVLERLGILDNDLTPFWHCVTDDYYFSFRCYEDDSFSLYRPGNIDCNYLYTSVEDIKVATFTISPNPAQNLITLKLDHITSDMTVSICDISGRLMQKTPIETTETSIPVTNLANGVYLLTVSDGKQSRTQKLVINH